ncbi:hypothetical protein H7U19_14990 [Hyunsoonleella sp. SJ7]|uniref:Uncharacterized protein n=1 Tax=Hyunsoonleella aquatilis TaxID=2762758 RepID=A0A923HD42_9FLAO|nr:hypothetical protein [Hyunsoonleella aquatilis]MBC3759717.1 hypothetical protein [Hyunsoonleella aquatilis]
MPIDFNRIEEIADSCKIISNSPSLDEIRRDQELFKLKKEAIDIFNSKDLEIYVNEILIYVYDNALKLAKNHWELTKEELKSKYPYLNNRDLKKKAKEIIADEFANDGSLLCEGFSYCKVSEKDDKLLKLSQFIIQQNKRKTSFTKGLNNILNLKLDFENTIALNYLITNNFLEHNSEAIEIRMLFYGGNSQFQKIIGFLVYKKYVHEVEEAFRWVRPPEGNSLKAIKSLEHFAAFLIKNNFISPDYRQNQLTNTLGSFFQLKIHNQNVSTILNKLNSNSISHKDQDYQDLFIDLKKL